MHPWPFLQPEASAPSSWQQIQDIGDLREDESVSVEPLRVLGVKPHELVPDNVGNRCHAPAKLCKSLAIFDARS